MSSEAGTADGVRFALAVLTVPQNKTAMARGVVCALAQFYFQGRVVHIGRQGPDEQCQDELAPFPPLPWEYRDCGPCQLQPLVRPFFSLRPRFPPLPAFSASTSF